MFLRQTDFVSNVRSVDPRHPVHIFVETLSVSRRKLLSMKRILQEFSSWRWYIFLFCNNIFICIVYSLFNKNQCSSFPTNRNLETVCRKHLELIVDYHIAVYLPTISPHGAWTKRQDFVYYIQYVPSRQPVTVEQKHKGFEKCCREIRVQTLRNCRTCLIIKSEL